MLFIFTSVSTPGKTQNSQTLSQVSRKLMTSNMMAAKSWEKTLILASGLIHGSKLVESISSRVTLSLVKTILLKNSPLSRSLIPKWGKADFASKKLVWSFMN